jgi:hypothetical protein
MKVYQIKLCVRGNPAAMQTFIVEAEDYKAAIIKAIERFSQTNNFPTNECAVVDLQFIEEVDNENSKNCLSEKAQKIAELLAYSIRNSNAGDNETKTVELKVPVDGEVTAESIDILRVDAAGHKEREIVGN